MSKDKKKVAIFAVSLRGGGAERIISYLINEGCKQYEFHLILLHLDIEYKLPDTDDLKILELDGASESKYLGVIKIPLLAGKLKSYLVDNKIWTLLSFLSRPNLIACYAKQAGWQGKLIISERADTIAYYRSIRFGAVMIHLIKHFYRYANKITVISKGIARSLEGMGLQKCIVIYNPICVTNLDTNKTPDNSNFTFISIARLEPQKNHVLLIKAFSELKNENCNLVIVGKGFLLEQLKSLSVRLNIADKVYFAGFQLDVASWLKNSNCFVFSSDYEGFGNVILEAFNAGVPVISTDCPYGPREILAPDTDFDTLIQGYIEDAPYGILTPVASVIHLAEAMRLMKADNDLRNRYIERARARVADFDIKKIAPQYFELF